MRTRDKFTIAVFGAFALGALLELLADDEAPLEAQPPKRFELPAPEVTRGSAAFDGIVVYADGSPAYDALVEIFSGGVPCWGFSDPQGRFRVEGLQEGSHEALVLVNGAPTSRHAIEVPSTEPVTLNLPPSRGEIPELPAIVRSDFAGTLAERVPGDPRVGYEVALRAVDGTDPLAGLVPRRARTDEDGSFRFERLVHGRYVLRVLPDWAIGRDRPALFSVEIDHPVDRGIDLAPRTAGIEVYVNGDDGGPLAGALVVLWPEDDATELFRPFLTDHAGRGAMSDLPAGRYGMRIDAGGKRATRTARLVAGEVARVQVAALDEVPVQPAPPDHDANAGSTTKEQR